MEYKHCDSTHLRHYLALTNIKVKELSCLACIVEQMTPVLAYIEGHSTISSVKFFIGAGVSSDFARTCS